MTNAEAVHFGLMIGMALGCELAPRSIFHRKNYFYPDLPKGYQISQYDIPLARDGRLGDIRIHRVHLEEDAAKLVHAGASGRIHSAEASVVDFNRGGTPLVEIVTEPDVRVRRPGRRVAAAAAGHAAPARRVRREHGGGVAALRRQRVDPPRRRGDAGHQDRAEEHELVPVPRARGGGRDRAPGGAHARRRRGDPGDAALRPPHGRAHARCAPRRRRTTTATSRSPTWCRWRPRRRCSSAPAAALPELPAERAERLERDLDLPPDAARLLAFRTELGDFFEAAVAARRRRPEGDRQLGHGRAGGAHRRHGPGRVAGWSPRRWRELVALVGEGQVSQSAAKEVLGGAGGRGRRPRGDRGGAGPGPGRRGRAGARSWTGRWATRPDAVEKVRAGKDKAIGAIVGAVMRETKGRADGGEVQRLIRERL